VWVVRQSKYRENRVRTEGIGQREDKLVNFWESLKMEQILSYPEILCIARCHRRGSYLGVAAGL